jgi:imidazole glycerol-phosphate synthase subunit HisH
MSSGSRPTVIVLDYGSGNVRSAVRALERVGADVELTARREAVLAADGLVVPGVGAFAACLSALQSVRGGELIGRRLAGGRPVLGICVGMQVLFDRSTEHRDPQAAEADRSDEAPGLGEWPGVVERLEAAVVPHMGWSPVRPPSRTRLFRGVEDERFYFVHSYAVRHWVLETPADSPLVAPMVTWAEHGTPFVAAVENGPLSATQFHPEKSGDAGATLLENWVGLL